ncbi:MAG: hypothetical protein WCK67_07150 [bacterium]
MSLETDKKSSFSQEVEKLFKTNPLEKNVNEKLFSEVKKFQQKIVGFNNKQKATSQLVEFVYSMPEQDLYSLFSYNDELIRSIAVRAYVDKNPLDLMIALKKLLKSKVEFVRHSAVMGLSYMNEEECLDSLVEASNDAIQSVKLAALSGIVDIANEYNSIIAKNTLNTFLNDKDKVIREFVKDELSIMF